MVQTALSRYPVMEMHMQSRTVLEKRQIIRILDSAVQTVIIIVTNEMKHIKNNRSSKRGEIL